MTATALTTNILFSVHALILRIGLLARELARKKAIKTILVHITMSSLRELFGGNPVDLLRNPGKV